MSGLSLSLSASARCCLPATCVSPNTVCDAEVDRQCSKFHGRCVVIAEGLPGACRDPGMTAGRELRNCTLAIVERCCGTASLDARCARLRVRLRRRWRGRAGSERESPRKHTHTHHAARSSVPPLSLSLAREALVDDSCACRRQLGLGREGRRRVESSMLCLSIAQVLSPLVPTGDSRTTRLRWDRRGVRSPRAAVANSDEAHVVLRSKPPAHVTCALPPFKQIGAGR